jgi:peptidoglycan hydrolase-like protein with peptidoglycan-binding domain
MTTMNNKYIKFAALGAIAIGGYLVIRNLLGKSSSAAAVSTAPTLPTQITSQDFPIKKGSKGDKVKEIQQILVSIDANALPKYGIDGDFGSETESALFKYLNKKSVDKQDDILTLNGLKDAAQGQNLQNSVNSTRIAIGNQIIQDWKSSGKSLYAKDLVDVITGGLGFSGQETNPTNKKVVTNALIVNGFEIKSISVLPSGYLKIVTSTGGINGGFIKVSPFAVVVK